MSIAQQNREVRRSRVGHDQIGVAVAVEVGNRNVIGRRATRKRRIGRRREASFAVAEKHHKRAVLDVGNDHVGPVIAIEVGGSNRSRTVAGGKNHAVKGNRRLRGRGGLGWIRKRVESHSC